MTSQSILAPTRSNGFCCLYLICHGNHTQHRPLDGLYLPVSFFLWSITSNTHVTKTHYITHYALKFVTKLYKVCKIKPCGGFGSVNISVLHIMLTIGFVGISENSQLKKQMCVSPFFRLFQTTI